MISKEETVKKLIEKGFLAELKDNVVYVYGENSNKIAKILKELKYTQSFGTGPKSKGEIKL
ncbi:MAG: hypothetical protein IJN92_10085 [Lachnospiraceae bacterium]|nr:hypothetical protein [Lachnospiraceae bacterium]